MGRRSITVLALAGAMLAFPIGRASAGGSWLDFDRPFYAVGEVASGRETFGSGALHGRVSDGPYYAYLVASPRWFKTPGRIPGYAIPIGPMTITGSNRHGWVARVDFIVPHVATGRYTIQYCNDPCTVDGLGDLAGGSLFIGQTVEEARLGWEVERLEFQVDSLKTQRIRLSDRVATLKRELADAESASSEQPALRVIPTPTDLAQSDRPLVPGWAIVLLAAAVAAGAMLVLRRRRLLAIPDTVPPELVEEVVAQVPLRQPATSGGSPGIVRASPGTPSSGGSPVTKS